VVFISQKTTFFIVTAVKTLNLTYYPFLLFVREVSLDMSLIVQFHYFSITVDGWMDGWMDRSIIGNMLILYQFQQFLSVKWYD
jgi:hypothetical protein